jgi:hypothetical protein
MSNIRKNRLVDVHHPGMKQISRSGLYVMGVAGSILELNMILVYVGLSLGWAGSRVTCNFIAVDAIKATHVSFQTPSIVMTILYI